MITREDAVLCFFLKIGWGGGGRVSVNKFEHLKFAVSLNTEVGTYIKGSDRLCKVVELSMQSCGQIL